MLHRDRRRSQTTQRVRETEAEAVAFVVSKGIGLDTNTAAQDYISLYSGDVALLLQSLEYIQQIANQILNSRRGEFLRASYKLAGGERLVGI